MYRSQGLLYDGVPIAAVYDLAMFLVAHETVQRAVINHRSPTKWESGSRTRRSYRTATIMKPACQTPALSDYSVLEAEEKLAV